MHPAIDTQHLRCVLIFFDTQQNKCDTHQPENYKPLQFHHQALHGRFAQYREHFRYYQQALHLSKAVRHLQSLYLLRKTGDRM